MPDLRFGIRDLRLGSLRLRKPHFGGWAFDPKIPIDRERSKNLKAREKGDGCLLMVVSAYLTFVRNYLTMGVTNGHQTRSTLWSIVSSLDSCLSDIERGATFGGPDRPSANALDKGSGGDEATKLFTQDDQGIPQLPA